MATERPQTSRSHRSPARFIAPMAGAGLVVACGIILFEQQQPPGVSASEVARQVAAVALAGGRPGADPMDGSFGPWLIAADRQDPSTGLLEPFRVEYDSTLLTAASAEIRVDAEADAFSLVLRDVVFVYAPGEDSESPERPGGSLHTVAVHELGPIPYGRDIVADGAGPTTTWPTPPERPMSPVANASDNNNADGP
jgi:hypothetical protein